MTPSTPPPLPQPHRTRWQPLRLGLVELFHYDSEEFHFHDGHLLLRGNNGTGKSKVLSLTLPFLFDAHLSSARVEPDGDRTKRMEWNLLMGRHDRRTGYAWIEFGRLDADGTAHFLTLGCGMNAVQGRARVEAWHFIAPQRIGQDLWLISPNHSVLNREALRLAVEPQGGQVFDKAEAYRRAVDERLFRLGEARYAALIDTLIQLRQPQLSKKPDEETLSAALSNALSPLASGVVNDVADAMNQLDAYRDELAGFERLHKAVSDFTQRYRRYAQVQSRRQARNLRQAQTEYDRASGELNAARAAEQNEHLAAQAATRAASAVDEQLQRDRAALDELKTDPSNLDATRLQRAETDADSRKREAAQALTYWDTARNRLAEEREETARRFAQTQAAVQRAEQRQAETQALAATCGVAADHAAATTTSADGSALSADPLLATLKAIASRRDEQIAQLRRRLRSCSAAQRELDGMRSRLEASAETATAAETLAQQSYQALERRATELQTAWRRYLQSLSRLRLEEPAAVLDLLVEWTQTLAGANPVRLAIESAQFAAQQTLAAQQAEAEQRAEAKRSEDALHAAEQARLQSGLQPEPVPQATRNPLARGDRPGAPLWRLIDFHISVDPVQQAGIEAALQAAGLLDAWVTPEGVAHDAITDDALLIPRAAYPSNLGNVLCAVKRVPVAAARIDALLAGIAFGHEDHGTAEAWFSDTGRYRIGPLAGHWTKPAAEFIGASAREAARLKRLEELALLRRQLERDLSAIAEQYADIEAAQRALREEVARAPSDDALRSAQAAYSTSKRSHEQAQDALAVAEAAFESARQRLQQTQRELEADAADLRLPSDEEALHVIERALQEYRLSAQAWVQALRDLTHAQAEHAAQLTREALASAAAQSREAEWQTKQDAERAAIAARDVLRETIGASVEALNAKLSALNRAVVEGEAGLKAARVVETAAGKRHAVSQQQVADKDLRLSERTENRHHAAGQLQGFADTGLLAVALPELELPSAWRVDASLNLARRIEQELVKVDAEEADWERIRRQVSQDYTELGSALSARGEQAEMTQSDYGFVVMVRYQNRSERPDTLAKMLADEIEQRRGILTARERTVMENHLQAEVAVSLQKLLREAERQLIQINQELHRHPTSTGVRFRLEWQPQPDGNADAAQGFETIRKTLVDRSVDAWSVEDRQQVGAFLQQRIAAERTQDQGGTLAEHLAAALDYRRWHRFRLQRWQDGGWKKLSGPASSGERAMGLTVPLFAAASSHYKSCDTPHAPRLVLLDEAFAGIDDEARAHCMALIREFDLDFVMTSEREWACYATLPGVSICQLLRQEGMDAVYVSRWRWDGRVRQEMPDPARRLPPNALVPSLIE